MPQSKRGAYAWYLSCMLSSVKKKPLSAREPGREDSGKAGRIKVWRDVKNELVVLEGCYTIIATTTLLAICKSFFGSHLIGKTI